MPATPDPAATATTTSVTTAARTATAVPTAAGRLGTSFKHMPGPSIDVDCGRRGKSTVVPCHRRSPPSDYEGRYVAPSSPRLRQERRRLPLPDYSRLVPGNGGNGRGPTGTRAKRSATTTATTTGRAAPSLSFTDSFPLHEASLKGIGTSPRSVPGAGARTTTGSLRLHFLQRLRGTLGPFRRDDTLTELDEAGQYIYTVRGES